jgi:dynein heavy chain
VHDSRPDEKTDFKLCTLSSCTTPAMLQNMLESFLERRQGRTYGPPGGKSTTILIDDLSMPEKNEWGDQTTNELFRQLLEVNGFYGLERPIGEMKQLVDVHFITAATKSEEEVLNIPARLQGKLCPILILEPLKGLYFGRAVCHIRLNFDEVLF